MYNNFIRSEKYYVKQQLPRSFELQGPSETFVKLPGLTLPFYHTQPLLYKIKFEGKCYSPHSKGIWLYLRLMIDDYLLYINRLLPNTANRYQYIGEYQENHNNDHLGGFFWFSNSPSVIACSFSDMIYLNPGLHVFDVGTRGGYLVGTFPTYVQAGVLTVEMIEYDQYADIGIKPMNTTFSG
ncbi:unnamed protein product [Adineta ricciae]|uniref:Uncharacterized protein n=1 Tax=Adineta ricciae TaxID=249248 RepID=A0A815WQP5_ADIRI|nr:unnamed protein product [Adineta ricciae]CAF1645507.1 unnamed protein product [Adineta ricciae]